MHIIFCGAVVVSLSVKEKDANIYFAKSQVIRILASDIPIL